MGIWAGMGSNVPGAFGSLARVKWYGPECVQVFLVYLGCLVRWGHLAHLGRLARFERLDRLARLGRLVRLGMGECPE